MVNQLHYTASLYTCSEYGSGSGFLAKHPMYGDKIALLVTCHHVIPDEKIANNCVVSFDRLTEEKPGKHFSGKDLFDFNTFKTDNTPVSG